MAKWILAAGAAALALTTPALAGQDKGKGGAAKAERGGGGQKAERGNGGGKKAERQESRFERGNGGQKAERQAERRKGAQKIERQIARADRGDKQVAKAERRMGNRVVETRDDRRQASALRDLDRRNIRSVNADRRFADYDGFRGLSGLYDNCPPGLAKKNNGCLPPGQAKKMIGAALPAAFAAQALDGPYRQWYRDNDQFYYRDDGDFIYRVNRDDGLINALFPFQNRDYSYYDVGTNYPADYNYYNVPYQYQSFYPDGNQYNYRYGDGAIYQVDRSNNMINSIVALLAGDLGVGQRLPSSYGVYNVPMAYRDRYYDTPDAQYRYNDGYIYQADPTTQLITAVISALV